MEPPVPQSGGKPAAGELTPKQAKTAGFIVLGVIAVALLCVCGVVNAFGGDADGDGDGGGDAATPVVAEASPSTTPSPSRSASPSPSPSPSKKKPPPPDTDPRFDTCEEAIAAGYGPYDEGLDPEYDWYRDADGDGVVCEPPRDSGGDDDGDDPPEDPGTDPRFDTCDDAIAAGYGPYRRGQDPEYDWYQDRDGDGVVCE